MASDNDNKVSRFPPTTTFTVEQALQSALQYNEINSLSEVLIIGYDADGDLFVRSSRMTRRDALFLLEIGKKHTLAEL